MKAQHGLSKVNQFLWDYVDRVQYLIKEINMIANINYQGELKRAEDNLLCGVFPTGTLINTERQRITRGSNDADNSFQDAVNSAKKLVKDFVNDLKSNLTIRIPENLLLTKIKAVFHDWNKDELEGLLQVANNSGRNYGNIGTLCDHSMTF